MRANTLFGIGGGTRRGETGELTSCRGTVQSAWFSTSSETQRREDRAARKGKWSHHAVRGRQGVQVFRCSGVQVFRCSGVGVVGWIRVNDMWEGQKGDRGAQKMAKIVGGVKFQHFGPPLLPKKCF